MKCEDKVTFAIIPWEQKPSKRIKSCEMNKSYMKIQIVIWNFRIAEKFQRVGNSLKKTINSYRLPVSNDEK